MRTAVSAGLLILGLAPPVLAQLAPREAVIPAARPKAPEPDQPATAPAQAAPAEERAAAEQMSAEGAAESGDETEAEASGQAQPSVPQQLAETDLDLGICLGRLEAFGTIYERGRPVAEEGGACGIANPVRVTQIVPGVALSPPGIMRCETAAALAEWVSRFARPASELLPDRGALVEVANGSAYLCRRINNADEGSLSEHAYGNALDVMAFRFASGPPIPVEPRAREGTPAEAFQRTVRAAACLSFSTVLGPGEENHDDHLHLDIKARESDYRLCQ